MKYEDLKQAVDKLQGFVKRAKEQRDILKTPTKKVLPFKIVPLAKMIASFVITHVSDKRLKISLEKRECEKRELYKAIDAIKMNHRLISKLEKGSDEERLLALLTHRTVDEYNALIGEYEEPPHNLGERITRYFTDNTTFSIAHNCKVSLPKQACLDTTNAIKTHSSAIELFEMVPPKKEAIDLFRMKVIRKIQEKQLLSMGATLREVRACPIDAVVSRAVQDADQKEGTFVTLKQTCIPLPGEKLVFSALYEQDDERKGIPIGDITYHLTSQQTGFPDPALTSGLGLPELFIPSLPLRPELAPTLDLLLERKREVAFALLPQGALNQKAERLYSEQKMLYEQDPSYFLSHHKEIIEIIFRLLGGSPDDIALVKQHYQALVKNPPIYEKLSIPYRILQTLNEEVQEHMDNVLFSQEDLENPDKDALLLSLQKAIEEEFSLRIAQLALDDPFAKTFLRLMTSCSTSLFLQSNSEKYGFPAPTLTLQQKRIQSVVFFQQVYFFQLLEKPDEMLNPQEVITCLHLYFDHLLGLLKGQSPSPLAQLAHFLTEEVGHYYISRYSEVG